MAIQLVNIGALPNDGDGDPLRVAFGKINNNFILMQQTATNITSAVSTGLDPDQVVFEYPSDEFTQALIQIQSYREDNDDTQNALIGASIHSMGDAVSFTTYGITNTGDWLTRYNMDVSGGNVRLLVTPLQDQVIQHFIAYQVTFAGDLGLGVPMIAEGGAGLITETSNINITTEN